MRLCAIVPTHDRPAALQECLKTLEIQTISPSKFEVLVIDDGSHSDIRSVVSEATSTGPITIRYERQELGGLNSARNRGVAASGGDVVAFLDDDTLVAPEWASAMLSAFEAHPCAAVGGRVTLGLSSPAPDWMGELKHFLAAYDLGPDARWLDDEPVPVGANCAVRRSDFDRVGGFRAGLDRIGGSLVSNGEPHASVVHCVPAERLTIDYFLRRHRAQAISDELLLRHQGHVATIGHKVGLAREVAKSVSTYLADLLFRRDAVRSRFLVGYWTARLGATRLSTPE
jgi:glycosyltransferase involved in cell wall biosynthesis